MYRAALVLSVLLLAACRPADELMLFSQGGADQSELVADGPTIGPERAFGAVLFLHGSLLRGEHGRIGRLPEVVDEFRSGDFDIYRLNLSHSDDYADGRFRVVPKAIAALRARGYRHITAIGHSAGGLTAMIYGTQPIEAGGVEAAIAFAPGWNANDSLERQRDHVRIALSEIRPDARIAAFYFMHDELGTYSKELMAEAVRVSADQGRLLMIRMPPREIAVMHSGHTLWTFKHRYLGCLITFVKANQTTPSVCPDY